MKILTISNNYPTKAKPGYGAFVYNLMQQMAKEHSVTIVTPYKLHELFKNKHKSYGNESCEVLRPPFISFSKKQLGPINTGKWSSYCYKKAVLRALNRQINKPDIIYTHFFSNAIPVLDYAKNNKIPLVVASGEATYTLFTGMSASLKDKIKESVNHIICVSQQNKEQLIELGFEESKMTIIPNAVNYDLFKPLDQNRCKKQLGLSTEKFTVGFIGHFIHRKGPNRIIEAIKKLKDENIQLVCVGGNGSLTPNNFTKTLSPIPNHQLPEIYNAFDVFVLPTLHEGHCNVIEEAIACGIPIISSKGTSVEEQVDETIGLLVDPLNINEIADAISMLKKNKEIRQSMTDTMILKIGENSITDRARKIEDILSEVCRFAVIN